MWRAQALEDTEPINSFVKKQKQHYAVSGASIRQKIPGDIHPVYFYQYLLIFLKTTTLPIVLLYTALAPAVRFTSMRGPARPSAPPYNATDDSPVHPRSRFTRPHRLTTWMTTCSSAPAYKRHVQFICLFPRPIHP